LPGSEAVETENFLLEFLSEDKLERVSRVPVKKETEDPFPLLPC
jgi:hypothetical protein